jgi:hypothetical protein
MKKLAALISATMLGGTLLMAPPVTAAQPVSVQAALKDYPLSKRNAFWRLVTSYEPMAKYGGKKNVIGLGVATCDLLRVGGTVEDLALLVLDAEPDMQDTLMAIIAAAPVVLCPDQDHKFD